MTDTALNNKKREISSDAPSSNRSKKLRQRIESDSDLSDIDNDESYNNNNDDVHDNSNHDIKEDSIDEDSKPSVKKESSESLSDDKPKSGRRPRQSKRQSSSTSSNSKATPKSSKSKVKTEIETPKTEPETPSKTPLKVKSENGEVKDENEEDDEQYKWWAEQGGLGDGTVRWQTLEHNGVFFPPEYVPLPSNIKMQYDGKNVELSDEAEEVALFYAGVLGSDHTQDEVFNKNFFNDFLGVLKENPPKDGTKIRDFEKCNFMPLREHLDREKEKKKAMTKDEKKKAKQEREEIEKPFTYCLLDGRKEKVGNFRIEPPQLFRGRGKHPKKGKLKLRIKPEQITINIGKDAKIPEPPKGHNWKSVQHDNTVTWLAMWKENINGNYKYVYLAPGSTLKGQSDLSKFEKARELKNYIGKIRQDYEADLTNKVMFDRQRATASYLVDRLALRAGNEKGEDEADTVGCCSLRCEHVMLRPPNLVTFDFLGKDSVRFYQEDIEVDPQVFKNLRIFKREPKGPQDPIFDRMSTVVLNKYFSQYMKGLSAKVFRTYNASIRFQEDLRQTPQEGTLQEKLLAYNRANRAVAVLCNHQKNVSKTHGAAMEKMGDKLKAIKYQRLKTRIMLQQLDSDTIKKNKKILQDESDLEEEWVDAHEEELCEKEKERTRKKFDKENEKLLSEDQKEMKPEELDERIKAVDEKYNVLKNDRKFNKLDGGRKNEEQLLQQLQKIEDKIEAFKVSAQDKDEGKDVSLGTSKINYIDPRISVAWCKEYDVPIEKVFAKTLVTKFTWAMEVDENFKF